MQYSTSAGWRQRGYERSPLFCILLIKLNAMQRQRAILPERYAQLGNNYYLKV